MNVEAKNGRAQRLGTILAEWMLGAAQQQELTTAFESIVMTRSIADCICRLSLTDINSRTFGIALLPLSAARVIMFDLHLRVLKDRILEPIVTIIQQRNVTPNQISLAAFVMGLLCAFVSRQNEQRALIATLSAHSRSPFVFASSPLSVVSGYPSSSGHSIVFSMELMVSWRDVRIK